MQLPRVTKQNLKNRIQAHKVKLCAYEGCGKEFVGHTLRKYCDFHIDINNRKRIRRPVTDPAINNLVFKHKFNETKEIIFKCAFEDCNEEFKLKIYPKVFVYPKYCEKHRSLFKRINAKRCKKLLTA